MIQNKIKYKTISVELGKEDYVIALMNKIGFNEVERKATGGYMSNEKLQITFSGDKDDYHENDYIKIPEPNSDWFYFFSIKYPDGNVCKTDKSFFYEIKNNTQTFEILTIPK